VLYVEHKERFLPEGMCSSRLTNTFLPNWQHLHTLDCQPKLKKPELSQNWIVTFEFCNRTEMHVWSARKAKMQPKIFSVGTDVSACGV